ncbi:uncharacterized protein [Amphiura filiformis]|uniref:uncharacterized protein n=1 Tax=Amphiura filiformis TaxID=82378 RepID=UPI003B219B5E
MPALIFVSLLLLTAAVKGKDVSEESRTLVLTVATNADAMAMSSDQFLGATNCTLTISNNSLSELKLLMALSPAIIYMKLHFTDLEFESETAYLNETRNILDPFTWIWARKGKGYLLRGFFDNYLVSSFGILKSGVHDTSIRINTMECPNFMNVSDSTKLLILANLLTLSSNGACGNLNAKRETCNEFQNKHGYLKTAVKYAINIHSTYFVPSMRGSANMNLPSHLSWDIEVRNYMKHCIRVPFNKRYTFDFVNVISPFPASINYALSLLYTMYVLFLCFPFVVINVILLFVVRFSCIQVGFKTGTRIFCLIVFCVIGLFVEYKLSCGNITVTYFIIYTWAGLVLNFEQLDLAILLIIAMCGYTISEANNFYNIYFNLSQNIINETRKIDKSRGKGQAFLIINDQF